MVETSPSTSAGAVAPSLESIGTTRCEAAARVTEAELLLALANVEEASYLKKKTGASWPPQAAYAIAAECGLLPITLTIAAQVVRSWGEGWGKRLRFALTVAW